MPRMGSYYERRVFPWINDTCAGIPALARTRADVLRSASGRVIEIGFGTGLSLSHYPSTVSRLVALEPNSGMQLRAARRMAACAFPVHVIRGVAERLPFADATFDTAVSVLTLCSVAEPGHVLLELRRVLRDEGRLLVMEHGLSHDPRVARWQQRLNRLEMLIACGCHLNRPMGTLVQNHGFRFEVQRKFFVPAVPRTHGWLTVGVAVKM